MCVFEKRRHLYVRSKQCLTHTKKNEPELSRVYLRSPPALSAGPHMENQVSGPLGTDVCSPLSSSQSATEAVQEPGPLTTLYSHESFTPGTEGEERCSSSELKTSKWQRRALSQSCWQDQRVANTQPEQTFARWGPQEQCVLTFQPLIHAYYWLVYI